MIEKGINLEEEKEKIKTELEKQREKLQNKIIIDDPEVKITFKRLLSYFIIYSFLGFIVETIFGMLTKGVVESRQSCLYGPFCCIYGLGAAMMIPGLKPFKKKNWSLFLAGAIEGSIVEYIISWIGEMVFHIKWWDYSNLPFNINGRICLGTLIPFGIFGLLVIYILNPFFLGKISLLTDTWLKILFYVSLSIFVVDNIVSGIVIGYVKKTEKAFTPEVDNTEEMTAKVKEVLQNKSPLHRRLLNAYPKLQAVKVKIKEKKEQIKGQRRTTRGKRLCK